MPRPAHQCAHQSARPSADRRCLRRVPRALLAVLSLSALSVSALSATALASDRWAVTDLAGHVKVSRAGHWHTLEPGMDVAVGAWVKTGAKGRVTLERQGTTIEVKPRTQIAVAGRSLSPDKTVLMQRWGATSLDVDKRDEPHLEVHTPFLAAVVKGTVLDVNVGRTRSDIGVRSGSVAVRDDARGTAADLGAGQSAGAGQGRGGAMTLSGPRGAAKPAMRRAAPAPVLMAPIARSAPMTAETADMRPGELLAGTVLRGAEGFAPRRARAATRARTSLSPSSDDDGPRPVLVNAPIRGASPAGDWRGLLAPAPATGPATDPASPVADAGTDTGETGTGGTNTGTGHGTGGGTTSGQGGTGTNVGVDLGGGVTVDANVNVGGGTVTGGGTVSSGGSTVVSGSGTIGGGTVGGSVSTTGGGGSTGGGTTDGSEGTSKPDDDKDKDKDKKKG